MANHTSPIDVVILSTDRSYALVGIITNTTTIIITPIIVFTTITTTIITTTIIITTIIITTIINTTIIITTMMAMITKVGQSHGGFLGLVQQSLSRAAAHIWFQVLLPLFLIITKVTKVIYITIVIIVIIVIIIDTISVTDTGTIFNN